MICANVNPDGNEHISACLVCEFAPLVRFDRNKDGTIQGLIRLETNDPGIIRAYNQLMQSAAGRKLLAEIRALEQCDKNDPVVIRRRADNEMGSNTVGHIVQINPYDAVGVSPGG